MADCSYPSLSSADSSSNIFERWMEHGPGLGADAAEPKTEMERAGYWFGSTAEDQLALILRLALFGLHSYLKRTCLRRQKSTKQW